MTRRRCQVSRSSVLRLLGETALCVHACPWRREDVHGSGIHVAFVDEKRSPFALPLRQVRGRSRRRAKRRQSLPARSSRVHSRRSARASRATPYQSCALNCARAPNGVGLGFRTPHLARSPNCLSALRSSCARQRLVGQALALQQRGKQRHLDA